VLRLLFFCPYICCSEGKVPLDIATEKNQEAEQNGGLNFLFFSMHVPVKRYADCVELLTEAASRQREEGFASDQQDNA
jgi:hypothetical protein